MKHDAATADIAARRNRFRRWTAAQTSIDAALIARLVDAFYARVRRDSELGPIFASRVQDWDRHTARMREFWESVVLMSGGYRGQPARLHRSLPLRAGLFDRWLKLFEDTARQICAPPAAEHFIDRAHRIADSLQQGIGAADEEISTLPCPPFPVAVCAEPIRPSRAPQAGEEP